MTRNSAYFILIKLSDWIKERITSFKQLVANLTFIILKNDNLN